MLNENLNRRNNESDIDYQYRICDKRNEYGLDWKSVADVLNEVLNENKNKDTYRKWHTSFKQGFMYSLDKFSNVPPELDEIKKERMNLADERRMKNANLRYDARFERVHEDIERSVEMIAKQKPLQWQQPYLADYTHKEGLAIFSDWHKGLFTRNYWNNFDNDEFNRRVEKLASRVIYHGIENDISKLHVFVSGDLVNGWIHVTTRINATEDVVTQTQSVSETLAEVLNRFANEFAEVHVYFCRGNHDRVSPNRSDEIAKESFADFIPWYLKARLSHVENVYFNTNTYDDEIINANIAGNIVFGVHGHRDKISNVAQNLTMMTKVVPNYITLGHYHHHEELEVHGVEVIMNSSLSGVDSYAKELRLTGKPAQKMIIFDDKEGRICTYNIRLDK